MQHRQPSKAIRMYECNIVTNLSHAATEVACSCITACLGAGDRNRQEKTTPLGVIEEKLMVNPSFPLA